MKNVTAPRPTQMLRPVAGLAIVALLAAASPKVMTGPDPGYLQALKAWRASRIAELTVDPGWLQLAGLYWLHPGTNRFGSSSKNEVVLRGATVPPVAGLLKVGEKGVISIVTDPRAPVTQDGKPVPERALRTDRAGAPDVLELGTYRFYVIMRGGKPAIRVKDTASAALKAFKGIEYFPVDTTLRITGKFEPYDKPHDVEVPSAQGPAQKMQTPGVVRFAIGATACTLEPFASPGGSTFFFVFKDATSGKETYGASRFLDAPAPAPGSKDVVLDFNQAYNPPCAYTPYATCPMPLPQNVLKVAVRAGEKAPAGH